MSKLKHYNPNTGVMEYCNAKAGNCPFGGQHFSDDKIAQQYADERNKLEVFVEKGFITEYEMMDSLDRKFGQSEYKSEDYMKEIQNNSKNISKLNDIKEDIRFELMNSEENFYDNGIEMTKEDKEKQIKEHLDYYLQHGDLTKEENDLVYKELTFDYENKKNKIIKETDLILEKGKPYLKEENVNIQKSSYKYTNEELKEIQKKMQDEIKTLKNNKKNLNIYEKEMKELNKNVDLTWAKNMQRKNKEISESYEKTLKSINREIEQRHFNSSFVEDNKEREILKKYKKIIIPNMKTRKSLNEEIDFYQNELNSLNEYDYEKKTDLENRININKTSLSHYENNMDNRENFLNTIEQEDGKIYTWDSAYTNGAKFYQAIKETDKTVWLTRIDKETITEYDKDSRKVKPVANFFRDYEVIKKSKNSSMSYQSGSFREYDGKEYMENDNYY